MLHVRWLRRFRDGWPRRWNRGVRGLSPRKGTTWSRSNAGRPSGTRHVFASCPSAESAGLSWIRPSRADSREGTSHSMNSPFETAKTLMAKSETFCLGKRAGSRGHVPGIRTLKRMAFRIFPLSVTLAWLLFSSFPRVGRRALQIITVALQIFTCRRDTVPDYSRVQTVGCGSPPLQSRMPREFGDI